MRNSASVRNLVSRRSYLASALARSVFVPLPAISIPLQEPGKCADHICSGLADIQVNGAGTLNVAASLTPPLHKRYGQTAAFIRASNSASLRTHANCCLGCCLGRITRCNSARQSPDAAPCKATHSVDQSMPAAWLCCITLFCSPPKQTMLWSRLSLCRHSALLAWL